jgi:tetratricopeptide (TPR) repeat protein
MNRMTIGIVICGIAGLAATAHADRADELFKKGKKLLAEKQYAEACIAFEDSDRIDPGIGAKLNVARCYQEWGKLATAWRWFSAAEKMAAQAKDARAQKIHELVTEVDASVPRLTVRIPNEPGGVVKIDGLQLDTGASGAEQRVDPGPHQVDYIINGAKQTKVIPVERGGSSEVAFEPPAKVNLPAPVPEPVREPRGQPPGQKQQWIGLGMAGAGVLTLGVASVVALGARGDYKDAISSHCDGASDHCDDVGLRDTRSARHQANIATVVTVISLAVVGGGALVYFKAPKAGPRAEQALYLAPSISGAGNGLVLGGAF